jgi:hypothetical protein
MGTDMAFSSVATPEARAAARKVTMERADERALALAPIIAEIRASGITTPYAIAAALTARGIPTARWRRFWMAGPVRSLLNRLDRLGCSAAGGVPAGEPNAPAADC